MDSTVNILETSLSNRQVRGHEPNQNWIRTQLRSQPVGEKAITQKSVQLLLGGKYFRPCSQFVFISQKKEKGLSPLTNIAEKTASKSNLPCLHLEHCWKRRDKRHLVSRKCGNKIPLRRREVWHVQGITHHVIAASILFNTDIALGTLRKQKQLLDPTLAAFWRMTALVWLFLSAFFSLKYAFTYETYSHMRILAFIPCFPPVPDSSI